VHGVGMVESRPIDDYTDTVGPARAMTKGIDGTQSDDRVAAAAGILTASSADPTPLRLPLGDHAVEAVLDHLRTVEAEIRQREPVSTPPSATKEKDWNPPRNELR
jgi:hypothetical protein